MVWQYLSSCYHHGELLGEVMAGWGQELTEAFGLRGLFGVDFVLDAKGRPFLVEIIRDTVHLWSYLSLM